MSKPISSDLVGLTFDPVEFSWDAKDVMLYAVGVGAKPDGELEFVFEGKGPKVIPTYAVVPGMFSMGGLVSNVERMRLRPIQDRRILAVLFTTFVVLCGLYVTYTYIAVIFDRATEGDGVALAVLISILGIAGTVGSIASGHLTDRIGSRIVINVSLVVLALNFAWLPLTSATFASAIVAVVIWGICGWGVVIPQQHRLIGLAPEYAPILLSLYAMAVYGGTSVAGVVGAVASVAIGYHQLPLVGAALIACGLVVSEYATWTIKRDGERLNKMADLNS
jgi:predicted MFS family arabinose efflux permease